MSYGYAQLQFRLQSFQKLYAACYLLNQSFDLLPGVKIFILCCSVWCIGLLYTEILETQQSTLTKLSTERDLHLLAFASSKPNGQQKLRNGNWKWCISNTLATATYLSNSAQDSLFFLDITNYRDLNTYWSQHVQRPVYPTKVYLDSEVNALNH